MEIPCNPLLRTPLAALLCSTAASLTPPDTLAFRTLDERRLSECSMNYAPLSDFDRTNEVHYRARCELDGRVTPQTDRRRTDSGRRKTKAEKYRMPATRQTAPDGYFTR
jgi:hypothetical protein